MTGKPPILVMGKSGRVYVVTHYVFHSGGECIPLVKFDVTGQFEHIIRRKMSTQQDLSPPKKLKNRQDAPSTL